MNHEKRGQLVVCKDVDGKPLIRFVWSSNERGVFILSESEYRKRLIGQQSLEPVGFPATDVFLYDADNKEILEHGVESGMIEWGRMIPVRQEVLD